MIAIYCAVFILLKWLRLIKWFGTDDCIAFSSSKLRCNTSQKLLPGSFIMCSSYESSMPATTFILFYGYEQPFNIMHYLKGVIKLNKMTSHAQISGRTKKLRVFNRFCLRDKS